MQFDSKLPIYIQIADDIRAGILAGRIAEGEKLPSVRELCAQYDVTSITAQRATGYLEQNGITEVQKGVGSFVRAGVVAALRREVQQATTRQYVEEMKNMGFGAGAIRAALEEALQDE